MRNLMLLSSFLLFSLSACVQPRVVATDPSGFDKNNSGHVFGEKCVNAKHQLEEAVEEDQTSDLRELKRNIELHCLWRRN